MSHELEPRAIPNRLRLAQHASLMLGFIAIAVILPLAARANGPAPEGEADPFRPIFTLEEPLSVAGMGGTSLNTVNFQLPHNASQGTGKWYIVNLILQARLNPSAGPGARNYVSVDTNGRTAAQIKFAVDEVAGYPAVRWTTYELFTGSARGIVLGESVTLSFRNYLQVEGVRSGTNDFTLRLEQATGVVVASARLLSGSGVYQGELGPSYVTLDVSPAPRGLRVGDMLSVRYRVANQGFPARDVGLSVMLARPGIAATGPASRFLAWVTDEEEGLMSFVVLTAGRHTLTMEARSETAGFAIETINVDVDVP